jgi:nitrate/nitrite transporter NarK
MSLFALPGMFIELPGGIISDRFGMKKSGVTSLLLMIAGLARDFTGEYAFSFYMLSFFAVLQAATIGLFSLCRLKNERKV